MRWLEIAKYSSGSGSGSGSGSVEVGMRKFPMPDIGQLARVKDAERHPFLQPVQFQ